VLSSVAGERVRRADFIYGSSKAGLDAFTQGLGDALHGTGVHVMVVRPGALRPEPAAGPVPVPVRAAGSPLSAPARFAAAPLESSALTTTPDAVAEAIVTGLRRRSETVWVPGALRAVMSALRHVPRPLFRRLPL
ncbi:SDR family NAD(P)-dependent oxidoreductase, partial [Streptomyces sp. NPDC001274]